MLEHGSAIFVCADNKGKLYIDYYMMDTLASLAKGKAKYSIRFIHQVQFNSNFLKGEKMFYLCGHGKNHGNILKIDGLDADDIAKLLVTRGYNGSQLIQLRVCGSGGDAPDSFKETLNSALVKYLNLNNNKVLVTDAPDGNSITTMLGGTLVDATLPKDTRILKTVLCYFINICLFRNSKKMYRTSCDPDKLQNDIDNEIYYKKLIKGSKNKLKMINLISDDFKTIR